jgi:hypothetical protein
MKLTAPNLAHPVSYNTTRQSLDIALKIPHLTSSPIPELLLLPLPTNLPRVSHKTRLEEIPH